MRVYVIVSTAVFLFLGIVGMFFSTQLREPMYLALMNLILGLWGLIWVFKSSTK